MTPSQIRLIASLARRAAQLSAGQPTVVAAVMSAEHARLTTKLTTATLR